MPAHRNVTEDRLRRNIVGAIEAIGLNDPYGYLTSSTTSKIPAFSIHRGASMLMSLTR
jgi:hypothetical protein